MEMIDKAKRDQMASRIALFNLMKPIVDADKADLRDYYLERDEGEDGTHPMFAFDGRKVGKFVIARRTKSTWDVVNDEAFIEWLDAPENRDVVADYAREHANDFVKYVIGLSGEIPDGVVEVTEEGTPYLTARVDKKALAQAVAESLPESTAMLFALPKAETDES